MSSLYWKVITFGLIAVSHARTFQLETRNQEPQLQRREVSSYLSKRDQQTISLDRTFDGATLFASSNRVVFCNRCYMTGSIDTELTLDSGFNISQSIQNITNQTIASLSNLAKVALNATYINFNNTPGAATKGNPTSLAFATLPTNLNIPYGTIPQGHLSFNFNGMEMYLQMNTKLQPATYTLNIFTSDTPIEFTIAQNVNIGIVAVVDLILDLDTELNMSSGFHFKLYDGFSFNVNLFDKNLTEITMKGGQFEFLPVSVAVNNAVFTAVLRLGLHAGIELSSMPLTLMGSNLGTFSVGLDLSIYTNLAEFRTQVSAGNGTDCPYQVDQSYQLAIGAQAGASIAIDDEIWGPVPTTSTPIWGTTMIKDCAASSISKANPAISTVASNTNAGGIFKRQGGSTTTTSTTVVYTAVQCKTSGVINCPISDQSTMQYTTLSILVATVTPGASVGFPITAKSQVTTVPFGPNVANMTSTTGVPTPFSSSDGGSVDKVKLGLIVGLVVGLGVILLITILVFTAVCYYKPRAAQSQLGSDADDYEEEEVAEIGTAVVRRSIAPRLPSTLISGVGEITGPFNVSRSNSLSQAPTLSQTPKPMARSKTPKSPKSSHAPSFFSSQSFTITSGPTPTLPSLRSPTPLTLRSHTPKAPTPAPMPPSPPSPLLPTDHESLIPQPLAVNTRGLSPPPLNIYRGEF